MSENNQSEWGPIGDTVSPRIIDEYGEQFAVTADQVLPADTIRDFRVCAVVDEFLNIEAKAQSGKSGHGIRNEHQARYDRAVKSVAKMKDDWTIDAIRTACIRNYDEDEPRTERFISDLLTIEEQIC